MNEFERVRNRVLAVAKSDRLAALALANKLVADHPELSASWRTRSHVLWLLQKYDDALADSDRAISAQPEEPSNYFHKGDYVMATGAFEEAIDLFSKAILQGRKNNFLYYDSSARMFRAFCYCKIGCFEKARKDLECIDDSGPMWITRLVTKDELLEACRKKYFE